MPLGSCSYANKNTLSCGLFFSNVGNGQDEALPTYTKFLYMLDHNPSPCPFYAYHLAAGGFYTSMLCSRVQFLALP